MLYVYISQLEHDKRQASRLLLSHLARELKTSIAYLEMETDDPAVPSTAEAAALVSWSPEANEIADLVDELPRWRRREVLALVQTIVKLSDQRSPQSE